MTSRRNWRIVLSKPTMAEGMTALRRIRKMHTSYHRRRRYW